MRNLFLFVFLSTYIFSLELYAVNLEQLELEEGFKISIFAENLDSPRQMVEGENGTIFVAERGGQILALIDADKNGQIDSKNIVAEGLTLSTGISLLKEIYISLK